ncbi:sulfurtransferase [Geomicrobium sediminis]|uniref:Sulfurtransferase n=1 Tax=Geomicrobium sediminis TaxID=1347788 RepID=A0ABS2PE44_9BACL|nr:sulfurtransferase [Geomicrobium sediminis]MBM7633340.1 thiosulfate/3-mercaptopyruvate sulfurtransferase [Geomicrobium sediminis]
MKTQDIVTKEWLHEHLYDSQIVIADVRFDLMDESKGRKEYTIDHIPGAIHFDLKKDLSDATKPKQEGGRHPLPDVLTFVKLLERSGINEEKHVIVYDDQNGSMAGRLWWLLQYVGQQRVSILDENYTAWKNQGYPVTDAKPKLEPVSFTPSIQADLVATMEEVKQKKDLEDVCLVDARAFERFAGQVEPLDQQAGHIPGARNLFWKENINDAGTWKTKEQLQDIYKTLKEKKEVIVYCGSGVSATANVIGMRQAGIQNVKLYPGSWSEWSSYDDNPVGTKEED